MFCLWHRTLSVSPIGSSPLQLASKEPTVTTTVELSVSPIGSSPLQRRGARYRRPRDVGFQYPQSDRALCNSSTSIASAQVRALSVSPIGSSPLQPAGDWRAGREHHAFSIPNRIEPSATTLSIAQRCIFVTFSIPNRIEPSATRSPRRSILRSGHFQYPQSDRALCNYSFRLVECHFFFFQYPQSDRALCNLSVNC